MERNNEQNKGMMISRRDFVKISGAGIACVAVGIVPVTAFTGTEADDALEEFRNLPVYRAENIMRVVLSEGETACTGDPERTSERCTGCMSCVAICSLSHEGVSSSALSGIRVHHFTSEWALREMDKMFAHSICKQCPGVPPCDEICPVHAHYRSDKLGAVLVDHDKCVQCGACVEACPYDACWYSETLGRIVKCDLCHENPDGPQCVKNCSSLVLKLEEVVSRERE